MPAYAAAIIHSGTYMGITTNLVSPFWVVANSHIEAVGYAKIELDKLPWPEQLDGKYGLSRDVFVNKNPLKEPS